MSISLKERLEIWKQVCEEGLEAPSIDEKHSKLSFLLGGIQGTLGTPRADIRRLLDSEE